MVEGEKKDHSLLNTAMAVGVPAFVTIGGALFWLLSPVVGVLAISVALLSFGLAIVNFFFAAANDNNENLGVGVLGLVCGVVVLGLGYAYS